MKALTQSALELSRALNLLRRGWVAPQELRRALDESAAAGSVAFAFHQRGRIDADQLAIVHGSSLILGSDDIIRQRLEEEIAAGNHPELAKGQCIGGHFWVREVHRSGSGRVYICDTNVDESYRPANRVVALKTPLLTRLPNLDALNAFYVEAATWIRLGAHPNIVLAYGLSVYQQVPFIVMEYVQDSTTLAHRISQAGRGWRMALSVGLGIARALEFGEASCDLVHGDIKPLNILMTPDGVPKLSDFGLCRCSLEAAVFADDLFVATPGYLAPEMYPDGSPRTRQTDVYAFGVTLFEMLTGRRPFSDRTPWQNRSEPPPDPRRWIPDSPQALTELILQCMSTRPESRPASFRAIAGEMVRLHEHVLGAVPRVPLPDAPVRADALTNVAYSWLNLGRWRDAQTAAADAVAIDPQNWKALNALGQSFLDGGNPRDAVKWFKGARAAAPQEVIPAVNLALTTYRIGDRETSREQLRDALALAKRTGRFAELDRAGSFLLLELTPDEALPIMDRILKDDPGAVATMNNRAVLLRRRGALREALESAEEAIAINPTYAKALSNRATILVEMGRLDDAIESAARALALDETLTGAYGAQVTALARQQRFAEARACVARGLRALPNDAMLRRAAKELPDR